MNTKTAKASNIILAIIIVATTLSAGFTYEHNALGDPWSWGPVSRGKRIE